MVYWSGLCLVLGLLVAWLSRRSLLDRRSHGFYRFFVFEAIVLLLWRNGPHWFEDRYAAHQLVSWGLLFGSLYLLIHSLVLLRVRGGHAPERAQATCANFAFENTANLVQNGLYRLIRHPMYASLLLLSWGVFFKAPGWFEGFLACVASLSLVATARVEERENIHAFGESYRHYIRRSKMFIPYLL